MANSNPKNWIFMIPDENDSTHILYAPLHKFAVRISSEAQRQIDEILNGFETDDFSENVLFKFLEDNHLFSFPQSWSPENIQKQKGKPKLTLSITNKCNLRCIYCYAETGVDFSTMPWELAEASISYMVEKAVQEGEDKVSVTFHGGGEAFVEFPLLKKCVEFTRELATKNNLNFSFSAVTNATLISLERALWMKENGFDGLTVSLDGTEEANDFQRRDSEGRGSFSRIMKGINNLNQAQLSFVIRSTITNSSVDGMADFVSYASSNIFPQEGVIHFEPLAVCGRAKTSVIATNAQSFFQNYLRAKEVGGSCGIKVVCSMDSFKKERRNYCGASYGTMFCVTPSGYVSSCSRVIKSIDEGANLYFYGEYDEKTKSFGIDNTQLEKIIAHGSLPGMCETCFARWNCQGYCPVTRYPDTKDMEDTCEIERNLLKHFLRKEMESVCK